MTTEELLVQKNKLIERLGVHFEKREQYPPVASRILVSIMLSCKQGITFDQLVRDMGASKSTVFTHLNMLESSGRIEYFTKPGDRKRYYRLASNGFMKFIDKKIKACELESKIQKEIINYKQKANEVWKNDPDRYCNLQFNQNVLVFLEESIAAFEKMKIKLTQK